MNARLRGLRDFLKVTHKGVRGTGGGKEALSLLTNNQSSLGTLDLTGNTTQQTVMRPLSSVVPYICNIKETKNR